LTFAAIGAVTGGAAVTLTGALGDSQNVFPAAVLPGLVILATAVSLIATLAASRDALRLKPLEVLRFE
jgi:ABC-type antimicrobial peptide transport system permease subunit